MNNFKKTILAITLLATTLSPISNISQVGCITSSCTSFTWGYAYDEFEYYKIQADHKTPSETTYDPSGQNISPELIDRLSDEVNACLIKAFPNNKLTPEIKRKSYCANIDLTLPLDKKSFVVKIANDWVLSCDKAQQLLPNPVKMGNSGCLTKGFKEDPNCPCRWRAGIKCPNIIITTPSFYLYKDALVRFATTCADPWSTPELANCATPSTTPLSDGSDPKNGL